ncbi:hypothetical protein SCLCIDRAFT_1210150 [Scleroderma citrinum Foug A]|uniref:Uncharacterized protein n=1 Tax=Scleroderma citrinum Foug A TaxID=1036808 RepID=A0A0C3EHS6_9AGAM|nr:hypothetical protein SCLCIDRAFT_1210150 [Scleroderma citrinum Foug A]
MTTTPTITLTYDPMTTTAMASAAAATNNIEDNGHLQPPSSHYRRRRRHPSEACRPRLPRDPPAQTMMTTRCRARDFAQGSACTLYHRRRRPSPAERNDGDNDAPVRPLSLWNIDVDIYLPRIEMHRRQRRSSLACRGMPDANDAHECPLLPWNIDIVYLQPAETRQRQRRHQHAAHRGTPDNNARLQYA